MQKLSEINLYAVSISENTFKPKNIIGVIDIIGNNFVEEHIAIVHSDSLNFPCNEIAIVGIGFIDRYLHIQVHYDNIIETDSHGIIHLKDKKIIKSIHINNFPFWDENKTGNYDEIFSVFLRKI